MEKLTFPNEEVANIFADCMKIKGSIEKGEDGKVILAYEVEKSSAPTITEEQLYNSINSVYRYCDNEMRYLNERISGLYRVLSNHFDNHLPSPKTPSQMTKAVKALGLEEDYEVKKNTIYVRDGNNSMEASYY